MAAHAVHDLPAHLDDLHGERKAEVTLHQLGDQGVARLVALLCGGAFVDACGAVGGVDLTAQPDRHGHPATHEPQTPVLQREEPVGVQQRVEQAVDRRDRFGRYQPASQQLSREVLGGTLHLVEVESDVLAQIGIGARDVDFGHAQADGRATLLHRGLLLELGCLHRGIFREGDGDRLVERKRLLDLLRRQRGDGCECRRKSYSDCCFHIHQYV